jgi:hypothetical protein
MKNYFGKEVAERYDDDESMDNSAVINPVVDFLTDLARGGAALEFGIGAGRIALPLSQKGIRTGM